MKKEKILIVIRQKKTVKDIGNNEVPVDDDKDLEPLETKSQPIDIPKKERKAGS